MLEETLIVAASEAIQALVGAARLFATQRRERHHVGDVELKPELDRLGPVGVVHSAGIGHPDVGVPLAQALDHAHGLGHPLAVAIDADLLVHDRAEFCADRGRVFAAAAHHGGELIRPFGGLGADLRGWPNRIEHGHGSRLFAGHLAENAQFRERVGTKPVRTVKTRRSTFPDGEQAG